MIVFDKYRSQLYLLAAGIAAVAAVLLLRTQIPAGLELPELDETDFFSAALGKSHT